MTPVQLYDEVRSAAQFTRQHGTRIVEVGAGTDPFQRGRAGAVCHGVDPTAAVETTRRRLGPPRIGYCPAIQAET
jgi:hypothetical protein